MELQVGGVLREGEEGHQVVVEVALAAAGVEGAALEVVVVVAEEELTNCCLIQFFSFSL